MADLDDFFKKRDKKKKTTNKGSKFPTLDTDEFAKKLETISIADARDDAADSDNRNGTENAKSSSRTYENDSDWKQFDSEENKDYSGLRINFQTLKSDDNDLVEEESADENEKKPNCPWTAMNQKKATETATGASNDKVLSDEADEEEKAEKKEVKEAAPAKVVEAPKPASTGAYIPPSLRAKMTQEATASSSAATSSSVSESAKPAASSGAYVAPSMRNRSTLQQQNEGIPTTSVNYRRVGKAQPSINDTMEFPSLDAAAVEK